MSNQNSDTVKDEIKVVDDEPDEWCGTGSLPVANSKGINGYSAQDAQVKRLKRTMRFKLIA
jgi:hypothetical protein